MQEQPDAQLLRAHLHGDESAFREIVARHADLVYSAAFRQLNSPALAQDVAQSVFVDLVRKSREVSARMTNDASLAGWLYRSTRFAVLNHLRDEHRRAEHERQAMEQLITDTSPAADWERIRPMLDEAMAELSDDDRDAVLLRYFKNHDFRTVGRALGLSDDAAQKRVSRAVERLREFFSKRGVAIGAGGLAVLISANAVQAAPLALPASISTAAFAGTTIHTSISATKAIAMTTLQKALATVTIVVLAGTSLHEARQTSLLREQVRTLRQQQEPLAEQIQQLQSEKIDASNRLAALAAENAQLKSNPGKNEILKLRGEVTQLQNEANNPTEKAARALMAKVAQLKERAEETPGAKIPEMQFLTDRDWFNAANGRLDTDADYRRALASLRTAGESKFASMLKPALGQYMQANSKQFPTDLAQLQPYFSAPIDDTIIQRWEIAPASTVKSLVMGGDVIITQKAPVDDVFDSRFGIGPNGYGQTDFFSQEISKTMTPVFESFKAAHNGQWPSDNSQLLSYATTPEQQATLQKMLMQDSTKQ